jgi:transketolase
VLPGNVPTLSVEAASPSGWHRFSHAQIAVQEFGRSGTADDVLKFFGFTVDNVATKGQELVNFYKQHGNIPDLMNRPVFDNFLKNGDMYDHMHTN